MPGNSGFCGWTGKLSASASRRCKWGAFIRPETVFDVLYTGAQRQDWGRHFSAYQKARQEREAAEKKAAEVLATSGERDEFAALRGAGTTTIARLLRTGLPAIDEAGEKLPREFLDVGIKVGAEQAVALRNRLEATLRACLSSRQFDLFVNPNEDLARPGRRAEAPCPQTAAPAGAGHL